MKTISLLLLIAGLILAPAYWIYAKFYTGKQTAMLTLNKVEGSENTPPAWHSAAFELRPEMAPVGLILHVNASFAPNMDEGQPPQDRYYVTLSKQGEAAKPLAIVLKAANSANGNPVFKEHLLFLQVVQGGSYQINVTPASESRMKVGQMRLEVRQNLHEPNSHVVTGGVLLLVLGLLGLIAI
jgi:hypothetical protein